MGTTCTVRQATGALALSGVHVFGLKRCGCVSCRSGGNIMRREKGSKPGDIVLVDFGRVCVLQAANDLGGYLSNRDFDKKGSKHDWPPLDHRKARAQAYIDATPPEVVAQCSRTSIEEVVLDMEAGALMRDAFHVIIFPFLVKGAHGEEIAKWFCEERIMKCLACLEEAKSSDTVRQKILKDGLRRAAGTK